MKGAIGMCVVSMVAFGAAHAASLPLAESYVEDPLRDTLVELRKQIEGYRVRIEEQRQAASDFKGVLALYGSKKLKRELEKQLMLSSLDRTEQRIRSLKDALRLREQRLAAQHEIMGELLRTVDEMPFPQSVAALKATSFSAAFEAVRSVELVYRALEEAAKASRAEFAHIETEAREERLKRHELVLLHELRLREDYALEREEARYRLLEASAGKRQAVFTDLLHRSETESATLQEQFFDREGVGKGLTLKEAFARAEAASAPSGVRSVFVLALVAQESQFGAHQGNGRWREDMDPAQWAAFLDIAKRHGFDPDEVPVSKKPAYGWGGAMGPAQFLPMTWAIYEERVREITGHQNPSPWNIDDALTAAALKLAEAGADAKTTAAERKAALIYFAGGNWENPAFGFYADSIEEIARIIEEELT